jgi:hypothetical protein
MARDGSEFLDRVLGNLFSTAKRKRKPDPAYGRLYRWCRKNNISYKRDMSWWDFDDARIGTIGLNDGIRDRFAYDEILELAQKRIATGDPEANRYG